MTTKDKFMVGLFLSNILTTGFNNILSAENKQLKEKLKTYKQDVVYLVDLINRKEIQLDEFDMIALNNVEKKVRKENME